MKPGNIATYMYMLSRFATSLLLNMNLCHENAPRHPNMFVVTTAIATAVLFMLALACKNIMFRICRKPRKCVQASMHASEFGLGRRTLRRLRRCQPAVLRRMHKRQADVEKWNCRIRRTVLVVFIVLLAKYLVAFAGLIMPASSLVKPLVPISQSCLGALMSLPKLLVPISQVCLGACLLLMQRLAHRPQAVYPFAASIMFVHCLQDGDPSSMHAAACMESTPGLEAGALDEITNSFGASRPPPVNQGVAWSPSGQAILPLIFQTQLLQSVSQAAKTDPQ